MGVKYPVVISGEAFEMKPRGRSGKAWQMLRLACCDCGLIHSMSFAIEKNKNLGIAVRRENRATAAMRRGKKLKGLKLPKQ